jgi:hypothetical protein
MSFKYQLFSIVEAPCFVDITLAFETCLSLLYHHHHLLKLSILNLLNLVFNLQVSNLHKRNTREEMGIKLSFSKGVGCKIALGQVYG